jgi:hypothetical protein
MRNFVFIADINDTGDMLFIGVNDIGENSHQFHDTGDLFIANNSDTVETFTFEYIR